MAIRDIWKVKVGSYIFEAFDIKRPHVIADTIERAGNPAGLDKSVGLVVGKKHVEFGFSTYLKHLGTEGSVPTITDLLKAAGFKLTEQDTDNDSINDTFVYAPVALSDAQVDVDVEMQADTGYHIAINDAVVKALKITAKIGEPITVEIDFQGVLLSEDTTTQITGNYDTKDPFVAKNLVLGSEVPTSFENFSLEISNDIAERIDPTSDNGITGFIITGQEITGSIDPEALIKSAGDQLSNFTIQAGSSTDMFKIEGVNVVIKDREFAERNGLLIVNLPLAFYPSAAGQNDALTITFKKVS